MKRFMLAILFLLTLGGAIYIFSTESTKTYLFNSGEGENPSKPFVAKNGLYANSKYKFKVTLPTGFSAREITGGVTGEGPDTILFENNVGDGVQIVVTPYDDIKVLTADMIQKDIPDMKISDTQVIEIGQNYKGVAFLGDNPEFGGASRDVWFVFKGNLYQISTYARLDATLQSIFSTWQFE